MTTLLLRRMKGNERNNNRRVDTLRVPSMALSHLDYKKINENTKIFFKF